MSLTDKLNTPAARQPLTTPQLIEMGRPRITSLLGGGKEADRFIASALTEVKKNPAIMKCEPTSVLGAILAAAQLRLEIGQAGEVYLIPYGKILQVQVGYKGLLKTGYRSGFLDSVTARVVYENDELKYSFGLDETLEHVPATGDRGQLTHVYAIARLKGGAVHFEMMSKAEIDEIRNGAKSKNSTPWTKHYPEMAKKTVVRRLFKYLPVGDDLNRAVAFDEAPKQDNSALAEDVLEANYTVEGEGENA